MRRFTPTELAQHHGQDGAPAYIACAGCVYDVSDSFLWRRGRHQARHCAGADLTAALEEAPHGPDLLARVSQVGLLVPPEGATDRSPAP